MRLRTLQPLRRGFDRCCSSCLAESGARRTSAIQLSPSCRYNSTKPNPPPPTLSINGQTYPTDSWTNVPSSILSVLPRRLHLQPSHPIALTRQLIESRFPSPAYAHHNTLPPIVTVTQNFDSLGFPPDHPGRSRTDTYYINRDTVLRTHTSAHQVDTFRANTSPGFLISADVYRRDAIDRSHYPVFHQMEGARMWDRQTAPGGDIAKAVWNDLATLPTHGMKVEDPNPTTHPERNPLQQGHTTEEVEAIAAHLKRSLELVVVEIFDKAREAALFAAKAEGKDPDPTILNPPQVRWIEAYFPFTSPSWELEVLWQGQWLELLGCGVVRQDVLARSDVPNQVGWAFGLGLERIAMLLYSIPDIRLFWSKDPRFLTQFSPLPKPFRTFVPFSKHPPSYKDVAFWLPPPTTATTTTTPIHENDIMETIRDVAGDLVESVELVDDFTHQKSGRRSWCYRVCYRSAERTLRGEEVGDVHRRVGGELVGRLGVELR